MKETIIQSIIKGETSLGIELGSTRIKSVLIGPDFHTIASSSYEWENRLIDGYWTYHIDEIIHGLQETYRRLRLQVLENYGVPLQNIRSIGCSAMMQGYIVLNHAGELLVPFRTWRNATTETAATELTDKFRFKIPQRWSIAHLYQAILNDEEHVADIDYLTTLSGYVHWRLTGHKVLGIGDASGMFPVDENSSQFNAKMLETFTDIVAHKNYPWNINDILPVVLPAGSHAGVLNEEGAQLLDPSGNLRAGIPLCPPEGDAGTGMVATNSIKKRTGNISVGTAIFAMFVLEDDLSRVYPEIDMVATPDGNPVAMVLANNCSGDINAWVDLFREFYEAMGLTAEKDQLFNVLLTKAMEADADGGGLLSYNYQSAENITGFSEGRPLFVRAPQSRFNLANFMRTHLFSAFSTLRIGMDILTHDECMKIERIVAHGGLFKTPLVGQKILAAALNVPVSVMSNAGEGGAWGMAVLASYMMSNEPHHPLGDYLSDQVFSEGQGLEINPDGTDVNGFTRFLARYRNGLAIEKAAVDNYNED